MARPPKDPALRKNVDLRIPMTADQKQMVLNAIGNRELAGWARDLILATAQGLLDDVAAKSRRKRS
jgi:hypothetical protein